MKYNFFFNLIEKCSKLEWLAIYNKNQITYPKKKINILSVFIDCTILIGNNLICQHADIRAPIYVNNIEL